jgi:hypothetical protein
MDQEESNLSQWISEYPKHARLIRTGLRRICSSAPPIRDPELEQTWKELVERHDLASAKSTGDEQ